MNFKDWLKKENLFNKAVGTVFTDSAAEYEEGSDDLETFEKKISVTRNKLNESLDSALLSNRENPYSLIKSVLNGASDRNKLNDNVFTASDIRATYKAKVDFTQSLFDAKRESLLSQDYFEAKVYSLASQDKVPEDAFLLKEFDQAIRLGSPTHILAESIYGPSSGTFRVSSLATLATVLENDMAGDITISSPALQSSYLLNALNRTSFANNINLIQAPVSKATATGDLDKYGPNLINNVLFGKSVTTGNYNKTGLINRGRFAITGNAAILFGAELHNDDYGMSIAKSAQTYGTDLVFEKNNTYTGGLYNQLERVAKRITEKGEYINEKNIQTRNLNILLPNIIASLAGSGNTDVLNINTSNISFLVNSLNNTSSPLTKLFAENRAQVLIDSKSYQRYLNEQYSISQSTNLDIRSEALEKIKVLETYVKSGQILEASARKLGADKITITDAASRDVLFLSTGSYKLGSTNQNETQFLIGTAKYAAMYASKSRLQYERYTSNFNFNNLSGSNGFGAESALSYREFLKENAAAGISTNNPLNVLTYNYNRGGAAGSALYALEQQHGSLVNVLSDQSFQRDAQGSNSLIGSLQHAKVILGPAGGYVGTQGLGGTDVAQNNYYYKSSSANFTSALSSFFEDIKKGNVENAYGMGDERLLVQGPLTSSVYDYKGNLKHSGPMSLADQFLADITSTISGQEIKISTATLSSGRVIKALEAALNRNVGVSILFDYSESLSARSPVQTSVGTIKYLTSKGAKAFISNSQATEEFDQLRRLGLGSSSNLEHGNLFTITGHGTEIAYVSSARLSKSALEKAEQLNVAVRVSGNKATSVIEKHRELFENFATEVSVQKTRNTNKSYIAYNKIRSEYRSYVSEDLNSIKLLNDYKNLHERELVSLGLNKARKEARGYSSDSFSNREKTIELKNIFESMRSLPGAEKLSTEFRFRSGGSADIGSVVTKIGSLEIEFAVDGQGNVYLPKSRQHLSQAVYKNSSEQDVYLFNKRISSQESVMLSQFEVASGIVGTLIQQEKNLRESVFPKQHLTNLASMGTNARIVELNRIFSSLVKFQQSHFDNAMSPGLRDFDGAIRDTPIPKLIEMYGPEAAKSIATRASNALFDSAFIHMDSINQSDLNDYKKAFADKLLHNLTKADSSAGYLESLGMLEDIVLPGSEDTLYGKFFKELRPAFQKRIYELSGRPLDGKLENALQKSKSTYLTPFLRGEGGAGQLNARVVVYGNQTPINLTEGIDSYALVDKAIPFGYADRINPRGTTLLRIPSQAFARPGAVDPITGMSVFSENSNEDMRVGAGTVYDLDIIAKQSAFVTKTDSGYHFTLKPGKQEQLGQRIKNFIGARTSFDLSVSGQNKLRYDGEHIDLDNITDFIHEKVRLRPMLGSLQIQQVRSYVAELYDQDTQFATAGHTQQAAMLRTYLLRQELKNNRNVNQLVSNRLRIVAVQSSGLGYGDFISVNSKLASDYVTPISTNNRVSGDNILAGSFVDSNSNTQGYTEETHSSFGPQTFSTMGKRLMTSLSTAVNSTKAAIKDISQRTYTSANYIQSSRGNTNDFNQQTEGLTVAHPITGTRVSSTDLFKGPMRFLTEKLFKNMQTASSKSNYDALDLLQNVTGEDGVYALASNSNIKSWSFDFGIAVVENATFAKQFLQMGDLKAAASIAMSLYKDDADVMNVLAEQAKSIGISEGTVTAIKLLQLGAIETKGLNTSSLSGLSKGNLSNIVSKSRLIEVLQGTALTGSYVKEIEHALNVTRATGNQSVLLPDGQEFKFNVLQSDNLEVRNAAILADMMFKELQIISRSSIDNLMGLQTTNAKRVGNSNTRLNLSDKKAYAEFEAFLVKNNIFDNYNQQNDEYRESVRSVYQAYATPSVLYTAIGLSTNPSLVSVSSTPKVGVEYQFTFDGGVLEDSFKGLQKTIATMYAVATGREIQIADGEFSGIGIKDYFKSEAHQEVLEASLSGRESVYYNSLDNLTSKTSSIDYLNRMVGNVLHAESRIKQLGGDNALRATQTTTIVLPEYFVHKTLTGESILLETGKQTFIPLLSADALKTLVATTGFSEPALVSQYKARETLNSDAVRKLIAGGLKSGSALDVIEAKELNDWINATKEVRSNLATAISEKRLDQVRGKAIGEIGVNAVAVGLNGLIHSDQVFVGSSILESFKNYEQALLTRSGPQHSGTTGYQLNPNDIVDAAYVNAAAVSQESDIEIDDVYYNYAIGVNSTNGSATNLGDLDGDFYTLALRRFNDLDVKEANIKKAIKKDPGNSEHIKELKKIKRERKQRKDSLTSSNQHKRLTQWASGFTGIPEQFLDFKQVHNVLQKIKYTSDQTPGNSVGTDKLEVLMKEVDAARNLVKLHSFENINTPAFQSELSKKAEYLTRNMFAPEGDDLAASQEIVRKRLELWVDHHDANGSWNQERFNTTVQTMISQVTADSAFQLAKGFSLTPEQLGTMEARQGYTAQDVLGRSYKNLESSMPHIATSYALSNLYSATLNEGLPGIGSFGSDSELGRLMNDMRQNHPSLYSDTLNKVKSGYESYRATTTVMQNIGQILREGLKEKKENLSFDAELEGLSSLLNGETDSGRRSNIIKEHATKKRLHSIIALNDMFELSPNEIHQIGDPSNSTAREKIETKFRTNFSSSNDIMPQLVNHVLGNLAVTLADYAHDMDGTGFNKSIIKEYFNDPTKRNYVANQIEEKIAFEREKLSGETDSTKIHQTNRLVNRYTTAATKLRNNVSIDSVFGFNDFSSDYESLKEVRNVAEYSIRLEEFNRIVSHLPLEDMIYGKQAFDENSKNNRLTSNQLMLETQLGMHTMGQSKMMGVLSSMFGQNNEGVKAHGDLLGYSGLFDYLRNYKNEKGMSGVDILANSGRALGVAYGQVQGQQNRALAEANQAQNNSVNLDEILALVMKGDGQNTSKEQFKTARKSSEKESGASGSHAFLGVMTATSLLSRINNSWKDNRVDVKKLAGDLAVDAVNGALYNGPNSLGIMAATAIRKESVGKEGDTANLVKSSAVQLANGLLFGAAQPAVENYLHTKFAGPKGSKGLISTVANFAALLISKPIASAIINTTAALADRDDNVDDNLFSSALEGIASSFDNLFSSYDNLDDNEAVGYEGIEELDITPVKMSDAQEYVVFGFNSINNDGEAQEIEIDSSIEEAQSEQVQVHEDVGLLS
jgi:hypothetical protein